MKSLTLQIAATLTLTAVAVAAGLACYLGGAGYLAPLAAAPWVVIVLRIR